jgi:TrmH family RNA methyltransferase
MITKAEIQSIKALADKRGRVEQGAFIAEGEKLVAELPHGVRPTSTGC